MNTNRNIFTYIVAIICCMAVLCPAGSAALDLTRYTDTSVLAQGRWVKVRVPEDGLYRIPSATLRQWGFSNPQRVRVFGYGGARIDNVLSAQTYVDDLPVAPCEMTDAGLVFWGVGPGAWSVNSMGYRHYDLNVYSNHGYYLVGELPEGVEGTLATAGSPGAAEAERTGISMKHHEAEMSAMGKAGPLMVGEDFRTTTSRDIRFDLTDLVEGSSARIECSFMSYLDRISSLRISVDGASVSNTTLLATPVSKYIHGTETMVRTTYTATAANPTISIKMNSTGNVSRANLNYLSISYERALRMPAAGWFDFVSSAPQLAIEGATADMRLWDISAPAHAAAVDFALDSGEAAWTMSGRSERRYVAWRPTATLPAPAYAGNVSNQNLHGTEGAEMIIVSPGEYAEAAERLAAFHRKADNPLSAMVVSPELIYNEFSSGTCDISAFRKYFKMLYDRGRAGEGPELKYVVLMGRTTLDNRGLSSAAPSYSTLPSWMPPAPAASLSDNEGYCTDDFVAMLGDNSGNTLGSDTLSIAVGRIPVTSASEASSIIDKTMQYASSARKTGWKQRFLFVADDEDSGDHLLQTESMIGYLQKNENQQHLVRKVYVDNYTLDGSVATMARETMYRYLDEGVVWWNYVGHANETSWTGEGILSYTDLNNMYLRHWPFIYAATCNFLRFDAELESGAELLYKERYGGAIGVISAIRPVYISTNEWFTNAMGRALSKRDGNGCFYTPGEIYRRAKNDIRDSGGLKRSDENRLRFVFIGDPALPLATPSNIVRVDAIKGMDPRDERKQIVLGALEKVRLEGSVCSPTDTVLSSFNGVVMVEIFDADRSFITQGHGNEGVELPFDDTGERVYCGSAQVENGRFALDIAMPGELSQNFRPASMSLFAYATDSNDEAIGLERDFYVYGFDETVAPDTIPPVIESMVLNHSNFRSGDIVNTSPMLIAVVSDDTGINLSTAGIGHQLTAVLDGKRTFADLAFFYTPSADGSPSGVINYTLDDLLPGPHTLRLRVWDTAGNSATSEISFTVAENLAPTIYEVYTDANPAIDHANFYIRHDQPECMATVTIEVFNLLGRKLWSGSVSGVSEMSLSVPVSWNLCDDSGRRVPRGIYLYRATITTDDGATYRTASRRIAVAAE